MAEFEARRREHERLAAYLAALDDAQLAALLAPTEGWRINGLGNQSGVIEVEGARVFVKKLALTALERDEVSTANRFDLPMVYHYGVGSAGFGAWRELAAQQRGSDWAASGACPNFPLLHGWRVLPRPSGPISDALGARIQRGVDHWEGSRAIRARLEAIATAPTAIVMISEAAPTNLRQWLRDRLAAGPADADLEAAIVRLHDQQRQTTAFLNARGMLHFDLNTDNVLTDGDQVFVADFGLAACADFDLAPAERGFLETHRDYDRAYGDWSLVEWMTHEIPAPPVTPALRARLDECAPVAAVFGTFLTALMRESKTTPYPAQALAGALAAAPKN